MATKFWKPQIGNVCYAWQNIGPSSAHILNEMIVTQLYNSAYVYTRRTPNSGQSMTPIDSIVNDKITALKLRRKRFALRVLELQGYDLDEDSDDDILEELDEMEIAIANINKVLEEMKKETSNV